MLTDNPRITKRIDQLSRHFKEHPAHVNIQQHWTLKHRSIEGSIDTWYTRYGICRYTYTRIQVSRIHTHIGTHAYTTHTYRYICFPLPLCIFCRTVCTSAPLQLCSSAEKKNCPCGSAAPCFTTGRSSILNLPIQKPRCRISQSVRMDLNMLGRAHPWPL